MQRFAGAEVADIDSRGVAVRPTPIDVDGADGLQQLATAAAEAAASGTAGVGSCPGLGAGRTTPEGVGPEAQKGARADDTVPVEGAGAEGAVLEDGACGEGSGEGGDARMECPTPGAEGEGASASDAGIEAPGPASEDMEL